VSRPSCLPTCLLRANPSTLKPRRHACNNKFCSVSATASESESPNSPPTVPISSTQCGPHPGLEEARKILAQLSPRPKLKCARPRTRKAESAAVLTSSPYKTLLQEKATAGRGEKRKKTASSKSTKPAAKKPAQHKKSKVTADENDKTPCCICQKQYGMPPFEDWLQCTLCAAWYHESCGPEDEATCYRCLS